MIIDEYSFGRIVIDGQVHTTDVVILPDRVNATWWRREGHRLAPADLPDILDHPPEVLVIGTGHDGSMQVPEKTAETLRQMGIEVRIAETREAVEDFNRLQQEGASVVAALHLTC